MSKELEALGYKQLKDKEWRNEDLNGRIMFLNKNTKTVISIQHNEVVKFGGMEIESLTIDELKAVHSYLQPNKEQLRDEIISELNEYYDVKTFRYNLKTFYSVEVASQFGLYENRINGISGLPLSLASKIVDFFKIVELEEE